MVRIIYTRFDNIENMLKGLRPIIIIDGTEEFQDYGVTLKDLQDFYGTIYLLDEENTAHHRKDYILEDGNKNIQAHKEVHRSSDIRLKLPSR